MTEVAEKVDPVEALRGLIAAGEITQSQAAREMGVSATSLSQVLGGKYAADPTAIVEKIEAWLASREQRARAGLPPLPSFVETPTAKRVLAALSYAQLAGDIAVIYGAAGVGKSMAISEYQRRSPSVWVAVMTPGHAGVTAALEEVAFAVGLRDVAQSPARIHREVVARCRGTGGLIVVDEAQHSSTAALDALRSIHDAAGVGLALVGNDQVYGRMVGNRAAYLDRLFSRIGKRVRVAGASVADVEAVARAAGGEPWAAVKDIGRQAGGLRAVVKVLRLAQMMAQAEGCALADRHVAAARRDLEGAC